jgi:hypothetical protein
MGWTVQSSCLIQNRDGSWSRKPGTATALFQKSVILFDGKTQTWILNSMYTGEGDLWGCFGPAPRQSRIKPASSSIGEELDRRAGIPSFEMYRFGEGTSYFRARHEEIFNLELMRSMSEIQDWKSRNGFREITEKESEVFEYYFNKDMVFFGALISYGYPCEGQVVNVWTPPVQVTFESDQIWFPMKSSTTGDGTHSFVSMDLLTTQVNPTNMPPRYDIKFEGKFELGYRHYNWTRIEAKLAMEEMEEDLEIPVQPERKLRLEKIDYFL